MSIEEAKQEALNGKKVQHDSWKGYQYIYETPAGIFDNDNSWLREFWEIVDKQEKFQDGWELI